MNRADLALLNLSRFHEILKDLTESDDGKLHILKVVYEVWRNHPQVKAAQTATDAWEQRPAAG